MRASDFDEANEILHRRIGRILVEKELITADQLDVALAEHAATGKLVGEICVARFGLERIRLADVLAEQWDEMQRENSYFEAAASAMNGQEVDKVLRVLLDEARETRQELAMRADELGARLAALESIVAGIGDALAAPAPKAQQSATSRNGSPAPPKATATRAKSAAASPSAARTRKKPT
jgi:cell division septum initiation protein DivIVA